MEKLQYKNGKIVITAFKFALYPAIIETPYLGPVNLVYKWTVIFQCFRSSLHKRIFL